MLVNYAIRSPRGALAGCLAYGPFANVRQLQHGLTVRQSDTLSAVEKR
jgi:hypothetical protein